MKRSLATILLLVAALFAVVFATTGSATTDTTFTPTADSYTNSAAPTTNYGHDLDLFTSSTKVGFVQFNVSGVGTITKAVLRLNSDNTCSCTGFTASLVPDNTWTETGITYSNEPAPATWGTPTAASPFGLTGGVYTAVDVTNLVPASGLVTFVVRNSGVAIGYASRETTTPPQLVLTTSTAGSQPPTVPANLTATPVSSSQINLSWSPSTDPAGVTGYDVYRDGGITAIAAPSGTTFSDTGLNAASTHSYTVDAFDAAGNHSAKSASVSATTAAAGDTVAPSTPTNVVATANGANEVDLAWTASTDNVGVVGYDVFVNGQAVAEDTSTTNSFQDTGLTAGTTYTYKVDAFDAAGNHSPQSTQAGATTTSTPPPPPPPGVTRAMFYYPWYPETWGSSPSTYTHYNPTLGFYDGSSTSVVDSHIKAMQYGGMTAGIASWWGQGSKTDGRVPLLLSRSAALGTAFKWSLYYEPEGVGNPTVATLTSDLNYISTHYASDPNYLQINGKPVIFSFADGTDGCAMATRWKQANAAAATHFYTVLKVFAGYAACADQPDQWHQYGPAVAEDHQAGHSFTISPGFWKGSETTARLARNLTTWNTNAQDMVNSNEPLQLVTTMNEWGEGTSVESATQWNSASGFGSYLDTLHTVLGGSTPPPPPPGPVRPVVTTTNATNVTQTAATLDGTVNPEAQATTYKFDYGLTNAYGTSTPVTSAGSGMATIPESANVTGLTANTTYHFRVEATNATGTSFGSDLTFTTLSTNPGTDPVIAAAGDIACDPGSNSGAPSNCDQVATSNLILALNPTAVLTLGDNQYETNAFSAYQSVYDSSWGRFKSSIHPGIGNHEYLTSGAAGYFQYFGSAAGSTATPYYSFDIGTWHFLSLNDECSSMPGGNCNTEETWVINDLATHTNFCTLAYWHEPRFSSGQHGDTPSSGARSMWNDLVASHADIVLSGHNHDYERFDPIGNTPTAQTQPNLLSTGIREFVVGTGGKNHYSFGTVAPLTGEIVRNANTYGYLKLTLHPTSYDWKFVNEPNSGSFTDAGTGSCH